MYVLISVDNTSVSNKFAIYYVLIVLQHDFAIKDRGSLYFFLGIEARQGNGRSFLSQQIHILDIFNRTKMIEAKPIGTPMSTSSSLTVFDWEDYSH